MRSSPLQGEILPDAAIRDQDNRVVVTEFLCDDYNECGMVCPDRAISGKVDKVTF
jgi:Fe-S-cluster-containing hydrogenase component 2